MFPPCNLFTFFYLENVRKNVHLAPRCLRCFHKQQSRCTDNSEAHWVIIETIKLGICVLCEIKNIISFPDTVGIVVNFSEVGEDQAVFGVVSAGL